MFETQFEESWHCLRAWIACRLQKGTYSRLDLKSTDGSVRRLAIHTQSLLKMALVFITWFITWLRSLLKGCSLSFQRSSVPSLTGLNGFLFSCTCMKYAAHMHTESCKACRQAQSSTFNTISAISCSIPCQNTKVWSNESTATLISTCLLNVSWCYLNAQLASWSTRFTLPSDTSDSFIHAAGYEIERCTLKAFYLQMEIYCL